VDQKTTELVSVRRTACSRGGFVALALAPPVWKQWKKSGSGRFGTELRQFLEYVAQIGEGIEAAAVATGYQAEVDGSSLSPSFATAEQPIAAADRQAT
jgi:hypothetical protein